MTATAKVTGTQALILSGGGAQAAYEIGVLKALLTGRSPATDYCPVDPGVLVGTSAGSINAALFLSACDQGLSAAMEYVEKVWLQDISDFPGKCQGGVYRLRANPLAVVNATCAFEHPAHALAGFLADGVALTRSAWSSGISFALSSGTFEQKALQLIDLRTFISAEAFTELIRERVHLREVRESPWRLKIAATNWRTGKIRIFDKEEMTDANGVSILRASSALPGMVAPVEIEGEPHVDGGIVMNTPLKPAIEAGADTLHVIHMDPDISRIPLSRAPGTLAVLARSLEIRFRTSILEDIHMAESINRALVVLSGQASPAGHRSLSSGNLVREASRRVMREQNDRVRRPLTLHLHYPSGSLNTGWLSFERENVERLIHRGLEDAVHHDCAANHCVFPDAANMPGA